MQRKLLSLLEDVKTGKLVIPDFQRDFVWTRKQIEELLNSVINRKTGGRRDVHQVPFVGKLGRAPSVTAPFKMRKDGPTRLNDTLCPRESKH